MISATAHTTQSHVFVVLSKNYKILKNVCFREILECRMLERSAMQKRYAVEFSKLRKSADRGERSRRNAIIGEAKRQICYSVRNKRKKGVTKSMCLCSAKIDKLLRGTSGELIHVKVVDLFDEFGNYRFCPEALWNVFERSALYELRKIVKQHIHNKAERSGYPTRRFASAKTVMRFSLYQNIYSLPEDIISSCAEENGVFEPTPLHFRRAVRLMVATSSKELIELEIDPRPNSFSTALRDELCETEERGENDRRGETEEKNTHLNIDTLCYGEFIIFTKYRSRGPLCGARK